MKIIDQYEKRLQRLFDEIKDIPEAKIEMQSEWAKYICVLISGYIETSIRSIFNEYTKNKASPKVAKFVDKNLDFFQNPKMEKILNLVNSFDTKWGKKLEETSNVEIKDAVNSIVANRNNIAHGENVGLTYNRVSEYYKKVKKLIDYMKNEYK